MEIAAAVNDILATGILTLGPYTRRFEDAFAAAHGGEASRLEAVATSSGTSALEIALRAADVTGRDVIVPANTFYATAAAVIRAGLHGRARSRGRWGRSGCNRAARSPPPACSDRGLIDR